MVYWKMMESKCPPVLAKKMILEKTIKTEIADEYWWELFPNFIAQIKPTKLRYFQYRILVGALTTNVKLHRWSKGHISDKCIFCHSWQKSVMHILYECEEVQKLWKALEKILHYFYGVQIKFTAKLVILNDYSGPQKSIVNVLIIVLKQHIYSEKCFGRIPTFQRYMTKLSWWYQIDKQYLYQNYSTVKAKNFDKKWKNLF